VTRRHHPLQGQRLEAVSAGAAAVVVRLVDATRIYGAGRPSSPARATGSGRKRRFSWPRTASTRSFTSTAEPMTRSAC
jgi:hypothetical protein